MLTPKKKNKQLDFVHLHVHDHHSLLDGLGSPEEYVKKAKELGMKSIAITNHGNVNSAIEFQKACDEASIKCVLGVEFYIVPNGDIKEKGEKRGHLTAWIKNETGWKNVLKMLSKANLYSFYYKPRVDFNDVLENSDGLFFGSACAGSVLNIEGGEEFYIELYKKTKSCFLEIMPHDFPEQEEMNKKCWELYRTNKIPLICTQDCHYVDKEDAYTHEVLLAMQTKKKMSDPDRWKFTTDSFYLNDAKNMLTNFEKQGIVDKNTVKQAMKNTLYIAENCNYRIEKKDIYLPEVPRYKGMDEEEILIDLCQKSFEKKFGSKIELR